MGPDSGKASIAACRELKRLPITPSQLVEVYHVRRAERARPSCWRTLPKGFHKARYYGLWHHSICSLQQRALLLSLETPTDVATPMMVTEVGAEAQHMADEHYVGTETSDGAIRPRCPHCGSDRVVHLAEVPWGRSP